MLEVHNLQAGYGKFGVLEDVSFSVKEGSFFGILGRNGVGKTTLLKTIAGAVTPSSGKIYFKGKAIQGEDADAISQHGVALVLDRKGIFRGLTVHENLLLARRLHRHKTCKWTIDSIFDMFPRLAERAEAHGGVLSGGEQQMLAIGRALLTQPNLVLFDEPTEGLAPKVVDELIALLQRLRRAGLTAVVVDQRLDTVFSTCTEAVVMGRGRVEVHAEVSALRSDVVTLHQHLGV